MPQLIYHKILFFVALDVLNWFFQRMGYFKVQRGFYFFVAKSVLHNRSIFRMPNFIFGIMFLKCNLKNNSFESQYGVFRFAVFLVWFSNCNSRHAIKNTVGKSAKKYAWKAETWIESPFFAVKWITNFEIAKLDRRKNCKSLPRMHAKFYAG